MSKSRILIMSAAILALLLVSCDGTYNHKDYKEVDVGLRGTWVRTDAVFWPAGQTKTSAIGRLVLDADTITITDPITHLQGITRNTVLETYTEDVEGVETGEDVYLYLLYIKDKGVWQSPIQCRFWKAGGAYPDKMLTLEGGGVGDETLKLVKGVSYEDHLSSLR
ncbi:hypothetical protein LQZ19_07645 [Treponema primitia]|uniref:hypothetical protein n=1 Tax=Treponema primitia TaxID=88058 RepID=UPI00397E970E